MNVLKCVIMQIVDSIKKIHINYFWLAKGIFGISLILPLVSQFESDKKSLF